MAKGVDRIIVDTNLWISFLINKDFKKLDQRIIDRSVKVVFSLELLEEFLAVANRPKLKKIFNKSDVEELLDLFDVYGEIVDISSSVQLCRDPKDNFLLALAIDSKAKFLITGDKDLLELKTFKKTTILTITEYLKK
jgi:putative PIN family toxin of toxin-antitoxin system